jgi:hypothetical protein
MEMRSAEAARCWWESADLERADGHAAALSRNHAVEKGIGPAPGTPN